MTRILLLSPADLDLADEVIASGVTDSDTEIVHRRVIYPSCPPIGAHDWTLADLAIMAAGQDAQAEGFDAVCLADLGDYGANALRSLLDIPVVTAGRTSMLHALTLSAHFSVLVGERDYARVKKLVHEYALDSQCAGIHLSRPGAEVPDMVGGAEVLVIAGETQKPGFDLPHIPVIDPVSLVVKIAESLVGLRLSHSRRAYPVPQMRKAALIRAISHQS